MDGRRSSDGSIFENFGAVAVAKPWRSPFLDEDVDVRLILGTAIKFADLGHAVKPYALHTNWSIRISKEFWELGDREVAMGVPISPLCDRDADKNTDKCTLATWIGTKHATEFAVFLGVLAQFILFITHSKDFAVLNLPSLPLLCSFFLLPKLTPSNKTALAQKTAHKFLLAFVALTIARGVFYILAIYLHDDLQ